MPSLSARRRHYVRGEAVGGAFDKRQARSGDSFINSHRIMLYRKNKNSLNNTQIIIINNTQIVILNLYYFLGRNDKLN